MKKKNVQMAVVVAFGCSLAAVAMTGNMDEYEEMGRVQEAMRNLKRVDNLMYSYQTSTLAEGENEVQQVDVWADQLSGRWVSEYYTTDEDGTRCFLKQFCDGRDVYSYIDWNGEWELQPDIEIEAPSLDSLTVLDYGNEDITDIKMKEKGGVVQIDYAFTLEYIQNLQKEYADMMEQSYQDYLERQAPEEVLNSMQVTAEQYRNTLYDAIQISRTIDSEEVICGSAWSVTFTQPKILTGEDGVKMLGGKQELQHDITIQVLRYNQDGILNKIEQCQNEIGLGY